MEFVTVTLGKSEIIAANTSLKGISKQHFQENKLKNIILESLLIFDCNCKSNIIVFNCYTSQYKGNW